MKIICVGRNYVAHAKELNNEIPDEPVLFLKPDTALLRNNDPFYIPQWSDDVHHEVELIVRISRLGKNIDEKFSHRYYEEIGLGIDFTARDVQNELKNKGLPWEKAKAFDHSAVVCPEFVKIDSLPNRTSIGFRLDINGKTVQEGNSALMIFSIESIISHVSKYFTLKMGDLIFTGTPAGVGGVKIGDRLEGYLEGNKKFDFLVK